MPLPDLVASEGHVARWLLERGMGAVYFVAFLVAWRQFPALCGERGLTPATRVLARRSFRQAPSLFHWGYTDRRLRLVAGIGMLLGASLVLGLPQQAPLPVTMAAWALAWALYLSIVNVGGTFHGFGWETLTLEAGFLAIFLGNAKHAPLLPVLLAFRWLAFRVEFGAGLIKLRGDQCWRDLTCMDYHHETQPAPNPLSWFFHHLPRPLHRVEVAANFFAQLVLPFALFLPQPIASIAAALMIVTQLYLVVSGNYAWLNWTTIVILAAGLGDEAIGAVLPGFVEAIASQDPGAPPGWFVGAVLGLTALVVVLSWWPVRNLLSSHQAMNASFDPLRLVNTYGAFGSVSRKRHEVVVEGTASAEPGQDAEWREYEFKAKPGDVRRMPPQVAPYHLRLDWLMWFLPLSPRFGQDWFVPFLTRLLHGDPTMLRLLRRNPFPDAPPIHVRARLYEYRFTTWAERRETGAWWHRTLVGEYAKPMRLREAGPGRTTLSE